MPEKKHQHFVPHFYLKYFSSDKKQKTINLFNIVSNRLITGARLKTQARRNYFYGKDRKIEDSISDIESMGASIFSRMNTNNTLPKRYSKEHHGLLAFVFLSKSRTEFASDMVNEMYDKMFKMTYSPDPKERESIDHLNISMSYASVFSMGILLSALDLTADLKYKLILNDTKIPFITSDNPVIFYNQLMEAKGSFGSGIGIASTGLQVFTPVSPLYYLVLYDEKMYKMGFKKRDVFEIHNSSDVEALNRLQYYNANMNLYFNSRFNHRLLGGLLKGAKKRNKEKISIREFKPMQKKSHEDSSLFINNTVGIECNLKLSFVKLLNKAKFYKLGNKMAHLRNENICRLFSDYSELVIQEKLKPNRFRDYLKDNGINISPP